MRIAVHITRDPREIEWESFQMSSKKALLEFLDQEVKYSEYATVKIEVNPNMRKGHLNHENTS